MIPSNSLAQMYIKIVGENSLLGMAQNNLLSHLERTAKTRTHTYFANNGQTEFGISRNFGAQRYYSWADTVIDCRNCPNLVGSEMLAEIPESMAENKRFSTFHSDITQRMGGVIEMTPFFSILKGKDNMRYNIRCETKYEDFDIIRIGIKLSAPDNGMFKEGLANLQQSENPFAIKQRIHQMPLNA